MDMLLKMIAFNDLILNINYALKMALFIKLRDLQIFYDTSECMNNG